jgi:hypothetical protein
MQEYKELYSKLVNELVELHNNNVVFINRTGKDSSVKVRVGLRAIIHLEKDLIRLNKEAYHEHQEEIKEYKARLKEIRRQTPRKIPGTGLIK